MLQRLATLDLPEVMELVTNKAEDKAVLEAFEEILLKRSTSYQLFVQRHSESRPSQTYMARVRDRFLRDEIYNQPRYRFIYSLLQPIDQSLDCGCGPQNVTTKESVSN